MKNSKDSKDTASNRRRLALEAELTRIPPIIIEEYRPEKVILFGSLVTGEVHEWSDLDLAVIKKTNLNYFDRLFEFKKILRLKTRDGRVYLSTGRICRSQSGKSLFCRR